MYCVRTNTHTHTQTFHFYQTEIEIVQYPVAAQQGGAGGAGAPLTLLEGALTLSVPPSEKMSHYYSQWQFYYFF